MKTTKLTSVFLIICILMSVVSVVFAGTVSAETVDATDNAPQYETVLDLNFNSNNAAGLAATSFSTQYNNFVKNGYMTLIQNASGGATLWIGNSELVNADKTTIPAHAADDATATEKVQDCFELEPGTTYKITFKYRYRDDAHAAANIDFMCAINPFAATNHGRASGLTNSIDVIIDPNDTKAKDTDVFGGTSSWLMEWREETFIFVTKETLTNKYLGIRPCYNENKTASQIDDFKIEKLVNAKQEESLYEDVLDLNFDNNTVGGIGASSLATTKTVNGVLQLGQAKNSYGALWFANSADINAGLAKPPQHANDDTVAEEKAKELLALEPDTTYKITFKYRFRDDANVNARVRFMAAINPHAATDHGRANYMDANSSVVKANIDPNDNTAADETFGGSNSTWHEWKEETYIFTTKSIFAYKYLGIRIDGSGTSVVGVQLDDIKIQKVNTTTTQIYVFDYKTGDEVIDDSIPTKLSPGNGHYGLCNVGTENGSYVAEDGVHFKPSNANILTYNKYDWNHNAYVFDYDVSHNGQHTITADADHLYIVTVKYQVLAVNGNSGLAIALKSPSVFTTREFAHKYYNKTVEGSQYLTGVIDAASIPELNGGTLMLTGSAKSGAEFLIESVVVTVLEKDSADIAVVKVDDSSPYVYDIEYIKRGTEIQPKHTVVNNPTNGTDEYAYNISYVNPTLTTVRVDTDDETYAYTPNGTATGNTFIEPVEDAERGTVIQVATTKGSGASTSTINFNEFKPEAGKRYFVTFDAKLVENNGAEGSQLKFLTFYYAAAAGISKSGSKTQITDGKTNSNVTALTDNVLTEEWKNYGFVLNAKEETQTIASQEYFLFAVPHSGTNKGTDVHAGIFLVDNFKIVEYTTLGSTNAPNDAKEAMGSLRQEGTKADGSYQSAGLRFRVTVDAETKANASRIGFVVAPSKAAAAHGEGWYSADGKLSNGTSLVAKDCYNKALGTDVIYDEAEDGSCQYQIILTNLSTQSGLALYSQRFTAVLYVEDAEGNRTYYNIAETSYNEVKTIYDIRGIVLPQK